MPRNAVGSSKGYNWNAVQSWMYSHFKPGKENWLTGNSINGCPSRNLDGGSASLPGGASKRYLSYALNENAHGELNGSDKKAMIKVTMIRSPGSCLSFCDSEGPTISYASYYKTSPYIFADFRHSAGKTLNAAYCDGHAASRDDLENFRVDDENFYSLVILPR